MNKNLVRFFKRKSVLNIIGDALLTEKQSSRLMLVFNIYGTPKQCEGWLTALAYMVKYDLTNYVGRIRRLKKLPASPTLYAMMLRYGPHWKDHYDAASNNRTKHFKNRVAYWQDIGFSNNDAVKKVSEIQKSRSLQSPVQQKGVRKYSIRCVEYWMARGFSETEAKSSVTKSQSRVKSPEMIKKWLATLAAKTDEEKSIINQKKGHGIDSYLLKGYNLDDATSLSIAYYALRKNFSQSSQVFFVLLDQLLGADDTYFKTKNYEKQFGSKSVDFYHAPSKTVVEYYGDFWHRNPIKYDAEFVAYKKTSAKIWKEDTERIEKIASHPGVKNVIIIWESEVITNPHAVAEKIIKEIKNGN